MRAAQVAEKHRYPWDQQQGGLGEVGALAWIPWGVLAGVPVGCKVRTDQMGTENGHGLGQCMLLESGQAIVGKLPSEGLGLPSTPSCL